MITLVFSVSIKIEERKRLSRESRLEHTSQSHATIGTPCDVPVPKKVIFTDTTINLKK